MRKPVSVFVTMCLALGVVALDAAAQGMGDLLNAPRVKQRIVLQLKDVAGKDGKLIPVVQAVVDDDGDEFATLGADQTFLATGNVAVTIKRFNPLTTAVTVAVDDVEDPSHATLTKLSEALLASGKVLGAEQAVKAAGQPGCPIHGLLSESDWRGDVIKRTYDEWADLIDRSFQEGKSGPQALQAGVNEMAAFIEKRVAALVALTQVVDGADSLPSCKGIDLAFVRTRRDHFKAVVDALDSLHGALQSSAHVSNWSRADASDFIARDTIKPTGRHMRKVTVTLSRLTYAAPNPSELVVTRKTPAAAATFVVRRYMAWRPEIGVGLIYSNPKRPKYGTGKNDAGQTIIAAAETDSSSLDPSILVNFICGFCGMTPVTPMFQIGASTSKTSPALFFGGGIRLLSTGKGDVAIGSGLVVPWARQLKSGVEPGKVIDGTADLENQLEWRRVTGKHVYFSIQYKF